MFCRFGCEGRPRRTTRRRTEKSREEARKKLNLAADDFLFGNVGRLVKNKDQTTLIKAFHAIKSQVNAKLIIMGSGELEQELKNL